MMARCEPSLEEFSEVVGAIYDCAFNPEGWREALRLVGEFTESPCLVIGITDYAHEWIRAQSRLAQCPTFQAELVLRPAL